ncbi:MAG: type IV secretion system DNA-binding domain-containing protein, partial [Patescibacteria group bacterium]|nr:type IV secretion system DNA-binding domain-containing protein [Patescibacteria group bacterium]
MNTLEPIIYKGIFYTILIAVPIIVISLIHKSNQIRKKMDWFKELRFTTLRIQVPKNNEKTPMAAEQMFAALHGIFKKDSQFQDYFSFEIASREKYIQFYAYVPVHLKDFVEGQIYSQYPTAEIAQVDDYVLEERENIEKGDLKMAGTEMKLTHPDVYPIKTFLNFEVDPLSAITGVLSKVEKTEEIWIQILAKPISDSWQSKGINHVKAVKSGTMNKEGVMSGVFSAFLRFLAGVFTSILTGVTPPSSRGDAEKSEAKLSGSQEEGLKGVETKATKLGFEVKIRVIAFALDEQTAHSKLMTTIAAFKQFNLLNLNGFEMGSVTHDLDFYEYYRYRAFLDPGFILNIEELASIFHLPNISVATPNIVWAGSKKGEPPANLPIEENVPGNDLTIFAKTNYRHLTHQFGIKIKDRRYHTYAIGKTGTGKSTLLENMIIDDIREGRGVAVVDPHGDLINHLLNFVPEERIKDVIVFNPADRMYPIGFNILESVSPDLKNIVASGVVGIFKKIFGESWGPRLEYILRNTILALLDYPNATMLGITKILVDQDFRNRVIEKIQDPVIKDFFVNEYEKYDPKFRTEAIAPIQNKVGQFLSSTTIRNIVGQSESTINIEEIMNSGKILFMNLSIGEIGEDNSALLGAMMITKIQLAAMRRTTIAEDERRDFYLYVDEFQNFATESFATILSEARKYHLNLIMTNQYIAQVPEEVISAVFGNIGTLISFRVGAPDAAVLKQEFAPVFEEVDLVNLDNYHIYVKMSIDGVTSAAFSAMTLAPDTRQNTNKEKILEYSREHYSKRREYVEEKISNLSEMPKIDDILTKAQKDRVLKLPPKIGETYYREIQTPGDVRW